MHELRGGERNRASSMLRREQVQIDRRCTARSVQRYFDMGLFLFAPHGDVFGRRSRRTSLTQKDIDLELHDRGQTTGETFGAIRDLNTQLRFRQNRLGAGDKNGEQNEAERASSKSSHRGWAALSLY